MQFVPYPGECSPNDVARVLGVPTRTARYWRKQRRMPEVFGRLWALACDPDLGALDERWRGYKLADGKIWTPSGRPITRGDIESLPLLLDLQQYWRRRESAPAQYLMEF